MPRRPSPEQTAAPLVPKRLSLSSLRTAAAGCRACPLWKSGTQTVFGEGRLRSRLILVGEQPGDREDRAGRPFVGPAGGVLDRGLEEAGIERADAYVTNVVKHFKWEPKGKLRLHKTPNASEIGACLPWLEAEIALIKPLVLVALGATAAKALLGPDVRVTRDHGRLLESRWSGSGHALVTVHPSSILRMPTEEERHAAMRGFVADLEVVAKALGNGTRS